MGGFFICYFQGIFFIPTHFIAYTIYPTFCRGGVPPKHPPTCFKEGLPMLLKSDPKMPLRNDLLPGLPTSTTALERVSGEFNPTPHSYLYELLGWTTCPPTINFFLIWCFYQPSPDTFTLPNWTSIPNPSQRYNYAFDHKPAFKPFYRTLSTRYWCFIIGHSNVILYLDNLGYLAISLRIL